MNYFFDESGDFRVPVDTKEHAVGIVVGVAVPETQRATVWQRFQNFLSTLPKAAFAKDEPKGKLLDADGRRAFSTFVQESDGLLICPTIFDLTSMAGRVESLRYAVATKLANWESQCVHDTMRQQVDTLRRQIGNLSPEALFRLAAWSQCIMRCIDNSIIVHSRPEFHECWHNLRFEIDAVCTAKGNRESQVFEIMLPSWVAAWSFKRQFTLIEE